MSRILVVDDNNELATIMSDYLKAIGHSVEVALTGAEVDVKLKEQDFDLLILDWELPDRVGPDICKDYRDSGGTAGVMMLTGRKSAEDMVEGLDAGADDYLTKPFNIKVFTARVEALLRRSRITDSAETKAYAFDENLVGKIFADFYLIESVLGVGGMGIVYKAKHKTLERWTAIKVLTGQYAEKDSRMRFEREAKAMSLLDHANLVKIYDFGFYRRKIPYIVMEYVDGRPLSQVLKEDGAISYEKCLPFFLQICDALAHAHSKGIIHRDLKPSNIILCPGSKGVRVLDLGLAKIIESEPSSLELTSSGEVFGSPFYMSPEQCTNSPVDTRTDIYSLACVIYETICGERPFSGGSFVEIANAKLHFKAESICKKYPEFRCPPELDRVILGALEPYPEKRCQDMLQLKSQLESVLAPKAQDEQNKDSAKALSVFERLKSMLSKKKIGEG